MLLEFLNMNEDEMYRLVHDVYMEGNAENARWKNPNLDDLTDAIMEEENAFVDYLKSFFQKKENSYYILELDGKWISALRLTKGKDFYYLEALETAEDYRRKGYAAMLIREVIERLRQRGKVIIRDNVSKRNIPSLEFHKKCGFVIGEENGIDYLSGEQNDRVYGMILVIE